MHFTTRTSPYLDSLVTGHDDLKMKKSSSSWYDTMRQALERYYMRFLLTTTLYVMEPWERFLVIILFLLVISLVSYSALVYIPYHLHYVLQSTLPSLSTVLIR